jgi:hypothetical protein
MNDSRFTLFEKSLQRPSLVFFTFKGHFLVGISVIYNNGIHGIDL